MIKFFAAMAASIMLQASRPEVYMIEDSCSYSVYDNGIYRELTQDDMCRYRVMVVNAHMDAPGNVCKKIAEGDLIPYDSAMHTWEHACKVREQALKFFPAVIIEVV